MKRPARSPDLIPLGFFMWEHLKILPYCMLKNERKDSESISVDSKSFLQKVQEYNQLQAVFIFFFL